MSESSAPGPDGIPAILLKRCCDALKLPLRILWEKSLELGEIPTKTKVGVITPAHKGGARNEAKNYRPISLTSHIIKIFERVLVEKLVEFLEIENLLNDNQHGFRRGRSCLSQLLNHYQNLLSLLEKNEAVDAIYLDFAKAFDRVDHGVLLKKLQALGIGNPLLKWIHSFLTERKQCVVVDGAESAFSEVVSGVPQGTVLGPLLFLLHVGDIDRNLVHSTTSSFADDTRITKAVNTDNDMVHLQADLSSIYQWTTENNMKLNGDKFQHMRYGKVKEPPSVYYTPSGDDIRQFNEVSDLGVIMENTAKLDAHIRSIVHKGARASC